MQYNHLIIEFCSYVFLLMYILTISTSERNLIQTFGHLKAAFETFVHVSSPWTVQDLLCYT